MVPLWNGGQFQIGIVDKPQPFSKQPNYSTALRSSGGVVYLPDVGESDVIHGAMSMTTVPARNLPGALCSVDAGIRRDICRIGALLHERGFVAGCDGNISVRIAPNAILCTPTSIPKGMMEPEDLVVVDMKGGQQEGHRRPSSELQMHLLFYELRPDIMAVVHAHPPTATGFAAAGLSLQDAIVAEVVLTCGQIPLASYATPGTPELAATMRPLVPFHDAILMANHGVVTGGCDLLNAYMKLETVEHCARINLVARQLGPVRPLASEEVAKLMQVRNAHEANKRLGSGDITYELWSKD